MPIQLQKPEYLVIYVSDMARSIAFYRDTLGLPLKFSAPGWTEFNNEGTTIALHIAGEARAAQLGASQGTVVFAVDDIQKAYERLKADGVEFSMPPQKQASGIILATLHDPDGFEISLQQNQAK